MYKGRLWNKIHFKIKSVIFVDIIDGGYEIFRKNHINISANIANVGNDLFETGQWIDGVDYSGFSAGYGLETVLGPMEIKYSYSPERDQSEWYVALGYRF